MKLEIPIPDPLAKALRRPVLMVPLTLVVLSGVAVAGGLSGYVGPFKAKTVLKASELNAEFQKLAAAITFNDKSIGSLEAATQANSKAAAAAQKAASALPRVCGLSKDQVNGDWKYKGKQGYAAGYEMCLEACPQGSGTHVCTTHDIALAMQTMSAQDLVDVKMTNAIAPMVWVASGVMSSSPSSKEVIDDCQGFKQNKGSDSSGGKHYATTWNNGSNRPEAGACNHKYLIACCSYE